MKPFAGFLGRHLAKGFALLFLLPEILAPQTQTQTPSQTAPRTQTETTPQAPLTGPRIRVATHLVEIGVIVRDKNGPVADLTKDDFVVLDRGKPQTISVFSVESSATATQAAQPLPQNTFSDLPQYGASTPRSVTIVLLDNLNTLSGSTPTNYESTPYWIEDHALANAKQHLLDFLKNLDPGDGIAIYGLTDSLHVLCDFTCDRDQLMAVVSKYDATSKTQREAVEPGSSHTPQGRDFDMHIDADTQTMAAFHDQDRAQATMAALTAIANHVADIPGRKNLLWLTANLPFSGAAIAHILARANIAAYPVDARGLLPRMPATTWDDAEPSESPAQHALGIDGSPANSDQPVGVDAMQTMAEDTGGRAFVNTNDLTGAIRKAVEDSQVTYTLGFYIEPDALDGKFHELKVKVNRSELDVRYPKGYFAFKDAPATKDELHNGLVAAIRSPLDASAIPLQIRVDRVNQPAPKSLSLLGSIDIHELQLAKHGETRTGVVEITVVEQDQTGKVLLQTTNRVDLRFTEKQYDAILQSGIHFRKPLKPQAGATTLRVVVEDPSTAEVGSLVIPLSGLK
ncbi:MAG: VWA domain-containing protein [Candidatus Acidiferrum sp.]